MISYLLHIYMYLRIQQQYATLNHEKNVTEFAYYKKQYEVKMFNVTTVHGTKMGKEYQVSIEALVLYLLR